MEGREGGRFKSKEISGALLIALEHFSPGMHCNFFSNSDL